MVRPSDNIASIEFSPRENLNLLQFSILQIRVRVHQKVLGASGAFRVVIRANLNHADRIRAQIIDKVEKGQSYSTDFFDIVTQYDPDKDEFYAQVLLSQVGFFQFKTRVESADPKQPWSVWAGGSNVGVSVTPLEYGRNNSIYCAFIRQYGDDKDQLTLKKPQFQEQVEGLEEQGAYVIGPGGNFEKFKKELPFIIDKLGMKTIHLLPINPVPTSYGRMGMYGSPYATTDYFGIDHTYGTFSQYKTIEDQFIDLTSTIHGMGAKVLLDMVINHTGWASSLLFTHRKWFKVRDDRQLVSPGAWGVVWGDLVELDYKHRDLWQYMAKVFLAWCQRGIDGFRLDAGYMIPLEVWQYIISKVRQQYPNTMFLLEGLGGPWDTMEELLTEGLSNWAYSELFQNYNSHQIINYLEYAQHVSSSKGTLVHYAETHDNDRLAKKGKIYTLMRLYLSAFTSFTGAWGFTNGVEWLATERINVHRNTGLNWGSEDNLVEEISQINKILSENPAFWQNDNLQMSQTGNDSVFAFTRSNADKTNVFAGMINLDAQKPHKINWQPGESFTEEYDREGIELHDLLNDKWQAMKDGRISVKLDPGQCLLFRLDNKKEPIKPTVPVIFDVDPDKIALIYYILLDDFRPHQVGQIDQDKLLRGVTDFRKFIALVSTVSLDYLIKCDFAEALAKIDDDQVERYSALWTFRESSKEFILSGDKWLVVHTFVPCTAYLKTSDETIFRDSIPCPEGLGHYTFFRPQKENEYSMLSFNWKIERDQMIQRQRQDEEYPILSVPSGRKATPARKLYPLKLDKKQVSENYATVLLTNGIGGHCQIPARPGKISNSKYDAILVETTDKNDPTTRTALVKAVQETVQVGRKYFDLDEGFLVSFTRYPHPVWEFFYDDGRYYVRIERSIIMPYGQNSLYIHYDVKQCSHDVNLICKCLLEYRNIHDVVRAKDNKELQDRMVNCCENLESPSGVRFSPGDDIEVRMVAGNGDFIAHPHWIYDMPFAQDIENGLKGISDSFVPGLFEFKLDSKLNGTIFITTEKGPIEKISFRKAQTEENKRIKGLVGKLPVTAAQKDNKARMLVCALDQFLVRPGDTWMVMAGMPWLGMRVRDALYCVGGLLAGGRYDVTSDVILSCAASEKDGMLADWLGHQSDHQSSVESSLRLFLAANDYVRHTGEESFWDKAVDKNRSLRDVLESIYKHLQQNSQDDKPALDDKSGMIYCPACFSWMNTDHPQATPRQGYPIEVQALWYRILPILGQICPKYAQEAQQLCELIRDKFLTFYWNDMGGYLADVLLTFKKVPASEALMDSALRFNQLAAINSNLVAPEQARQIIDIISRRLLIPAGVRSLAEDPLPVPLKIVDDKGEPMVDPRMPYQGKCVGDEIKRRLAYHNGTAWPSVYPSFIEARAAAFHFSDLAVKQALAFFEPIWTELTVGGIGTIGEMKDGNYPHRPRGCHAYALSVAESLRVYTHLKYKRKNHLSNKRHWVPS